MCCVELPVFGLLLSRVAYCVCENMSDAPKIESYQARRQLKKKVSQREGTEDLLQNSSQLVSVVADDDVHTNALTSCACSQIICCKCLTFVFPYAHIPRRRHSWLDRCHGE